MPNKDKTGPSGNGPRTGRQMGNCEGAKPKDEKEYCHNRRGCGNRRKNCPRN